MWLLLVSFGSMHGQLSDTLQEVTISGTLKAVTRQNSAVPVEIYRPTFFKKNPAPNIFESLQHINGVRPQVNCSLCNTGDIHINGLEGPYTMVLIDGMPIVSGLSTVYGLSGIPASILDRVEIVKGPASSLYGSEAMGGLINIITKSPIRTEFTLDGFTTSWGEANLDAGYSSRVSDRVSMLTGVNYFNYSNPIDENADGFTDLALADRISVFQKWRFNRADDKLFSLMGRYFYEDRWGGQTHWKRHHRGGNEVYGESIYTSRFELVGAYDLPVTPKIRLGFSYADHDQNSVYGTTAFLARQRISFGQLVYDTRVNKHDILIGAAFKHQYYDDNSVITPRARRESVPGVFVQDEIAFSKKHSVLLGGRYDYHKDHGSIFTPRFAYKWQPSAKTTVRFNAGSGFRIVNLFTEEHAALSGSREVVIQGDLKPERSWNGTLNMLKRLDFADGSLVHIEAAAWLTHFTSAILPDYDSHPNQIIYANTNGTSRAQGISVNADWTSPYGLKANLGASLMDVTRTQEGVRSRQLLTERFSMNWAVSWRIPQTRIDLDYTGNLYSPMALPLQGPLDPRLPESPWWSIQNIQATVKVNRSFEFYFGVKNLLNWTAAKASPMLIARAGDPFDQNVAFDPNGNPVSTPDNPYALTFDTTYIYGSNQGLRSFGGLRLLF